MEALQNERFIMMRDSLEKIDPFAYGLGFRLERFEKGVLWGAAEPTAEHMNANGMVHGGYLSTMTDVFGVFALCLSGDAVNGGTYCATLSSSINFLRPARAVPLRCEAFPVKLGRTVSICQVNIYDAAGDMVCQATETYYNNATIPERNTIDNDDPNR